MLVTALYRRAPTADLQWPNRSRLRGEQALNSSRFAEETYNYF
jgi:hypothetical protein